MRALCRRKMALFLAMILLSIAGYEKAHAESNFEYYFFGQNLKAFKNCNWYEVAIGAASSVLVHELGHILYLELSGNSWDMEASFPSGLAVHTNDALEESETANFGRAGFALQTLIGAGLVFFEKTRYLDFTKGWVAMNAVQVASYKSRTHDIGDDFDLIDSGGSNGDVEFGVFCFISLHNLMKMESDPLTFLTRADFKSNNRPYYDIAGPPVDTKESLLVDTVATLQMPFLP
ncbi:MAG: hypothetical protein SV686_16695 [Thermodesulfobacteriota bacterium]|nr:hypothetical protein [Thermodesulfobacteriota bacterium]